MCNMQEYDFTMLLDIKQFKISEVKLVLVLKTKDLNKKLFKKIRAQIVYLLRNSRADPKNGVSYIKKRV